MACDLRCGFLGRDGVVGLRDAWVVRWGGGNAQKWPQPAPHSPYQPPLSPSAFPLGTQSNWRVLFSRSQPAASIPTPQPWHSTPAKVKSPQLDIPPVSVKDIVITPPGAVYLSYRGRWTNKRGWDIRSRAGAGGILSVSLHLGRWLSAATMKLLLLLGLVTLAHCLVSR